MSLKMTTRRMRATSHITMIVALHERSPHFDQHLLQSLIGYRSAIKQPVVGKQGHLPAIAAVRPAVAAVRSVLRLVFLLGGMMTLAAPENVLSERVRVREFLQLHCQFVHFAQIITSKCIARPSTSLNSKASNRPSSSSSSATILHTWQDSSL